MKSKLSPWTLNAKKWREDNGYTTPEWEMYVENMRNKEFVIIVTIYLIGVLTTVVMVKLNEVPF